MFPPSQDEITRGVNILKALWLQPSLSVPSIFEGRGQKNGEWGLNYLTKRACEIAEFVMKADERERAIFYSKVAAQAAHPLPSFPGPRVWTWKHSEGGFNTKIPATQAEATQIWWDFEDSHRWCNPQRDEWDLFYKTIPSTTPHFRDILKNPLTWPLSPFVNQPDFGSVDLDMPISTSDMHDNLIRVSNQLGGSWKLYHRVKHYLTIVSHIPLITPSSLLNGVTIKDWKTISTIGSTFPCWIISHNALMKLLIGTRSLRLSGIQLAQWNTTTACALGLSLPIWFWITLMLEPSSCTVTLIYQLMPSIHSKMQVHWGQDG